MILLHKRNGQGFTLNSELIQTIESVPDTLVTLTTGEKIWVTETADEVVERTIQFRQKMRLVFSEAKSP